MLFFILCGQGVTHPLSSSSVEQGKVGAQGQVEVQGEMGREKVREGESLFRSC